MTGTPQIVACVDGPLLVRGEVDLVSSTGEPIARSRRTVALCRCGVSAIKPFCDGTHKLVRFRTESAAAGGEAAGPQPAGRQPNAPGA